MSENKIVITERNGKYEIQNNGVSEFALIGILESILFDLKSISRREMISEEREPVGEPASASAPVQMAVAPQTVQSPEEKTQESNVPELRTRIGNAIKAIKSLGGEVAEGDLTKLSDQELQDELDELTNQYKRLKQSQRPKK